jgi:hypothetical protein
MPTIVQIAGCGVARGHSRFDLTGALAPQGALVLASGLTWAGTAVKTANVSPPVGIECSDARPKQWRSMPDPATVLPTAPEEFYALVVAQTRNPNSVRYRIDMFCRAIADRAFAKEYRRALLAIHRASPDGGPLGGLAAIERDDRS